MLTTAEEILLEASWSCVCIMKGAKTFTVKQELGVLNKPAGKGKSYWQRKWENANVKIEFM